MYKLVYVSISYAFYSGVDIHLIVQPSFFLHFLDMCCIHEQVDSQIASCVCGVDAVPVTIFDQCWKVTAMINMRMGKDGGINAWGVQRKFPVAFKGNFSFSLVESAIEQ